MSDDARSLDDLLGPDDRIAMIVTPDMRARPMTILRRDEQRLWFLTDRTVDWVASLADGDRVTVAVSDPQDSTFLSLTGTAGRTQDGAVLDRLWNPALEAWFDGRDDPNLVAVHVDVAEGQYWDGPGTGVGRLIRGITGVVTGEGRRTMGEQGEVTT
jgi:general stress protein 26